jgi:preprotein translocase subunit SecG
VLVIVLVLSIAVLVLVLVLDAIQYSNSAHWSASSREPLRSTIGIASV